MPPDSVEARAFLSGTTLIQTVPLVAGFVLCAVYLFRCRGHRRSVNYETIALVFMNSMTLTTALLLVLAAYVPAVRSVIPDIGIYIAISAVIVGHVAWRSLRDRVFFGAQAKMTEQEEIIEKIIASHSNSLTGPRPVNRHDVLVVVDVQKDFCKGGALEACDTESLIDPLNDLIRRAEGLGDRIVFTRDWHPEDHNSFEANGGKWPVHCLANSPGADWHDGLYRPANELVVDIGADSKSLGYSPFEDPRMADIVRAESVRVVYVVGIALEYCIMATCLDALEHEKPVVALEPFIRAATTDDTVLKKRWNRMMSKGVVRAFNIGA